MRIYHNPRCSKSRQTLQLLEENGVSPEVILYLKDPLSRESLQEIISMLGISPFELIRKNETIYKESFKGKDLSNDEWVSVMVENPKLIERPIVVKGNKALIGRPPEKVLALL